MARPKDFVTEEVLDHAALAFWKSGYQATSIPELESATGLGRGSLYNAFGDKEGLYLAVLRRYLEKFGMPPFAELEHEDVGSGIRLMLESILERMRTAGTPAGCLLTNTILECDGTTQKIGTAAAAGMQQLEARLEGAIRRAMRAKQIPGSTDAIRLARFFAAIVQSLGVVHKASADVERLRDIVAIAMQSWPRAT